jgi:hypothetical protein
VTVPIFPPIFPQKGMERRRPDLQGHETGVPGKGPTIGTGSEQTPTSGEPSIEGGWCVHWSRWIAAVVVGYGILWWLGPSSTWEVLSRVRLHQVLLTLLFVLTGSVAGFLTNVLGVRGSPAYPALLAGACIAGAFCYRLAERSWTRSPEADIFYGIATCFGLLFWAVLIPYAGGLSLGGLLAAVVPADWDKDE